MAGFRIRVDLTDIMASRDIVNRQVFPLLSQAVRAVAQQTQINWIDGVRRAKLWAGEKDAYAGSITWKMTGDFSAVVETDYKHAEEIDSGRPARDLKRMLDTSMKVRLSAKGKRYLIIPFRHSTPGNDATAPAMPAAVFKLAKALEPSRITGQTTRKSGTGAYDVGTRNRSTVKQNKYSWGGRLVAAALGGAAGMKKYDGMYKFNTSTPGGAKSSAYLTFRVMIEGSPGWITKPQPGQQIAKKVVDEMQPLAELAFGEAMKRSLG